MKVIKIGDQFVSSFSSQMQTLRLTRDVFEALTFDETTMEGCRTMLQIKALSRTKRVQVFPAPYKYKTLERFVNWLMGEG